MLHYSMSQPVAVVVTGFDRMPILEQALKVIRDCKLQCSCRSKNGRRMLADLTADRGRDRADFEKYKVSHHFDGTVQHPEWLTEA